MGGVFAAESAFFAVVTPLVPQLVREVGLTTVDVGILVAAYPAGMLLAAIPSIALVDRRGVRMATTLGICILIAATLGFGWGRNALLLDAARFVQGVGGAVAWVGALAWLISTAPAGRRASVIGAALGAALLGVVVGPALGAVASLAGRALVMTSMAVVLFALALASPSGPPASGRKEGLVEVLSRLLKSRRAALGNGLLLVIGLAGGTVSSLMPLLVAHRRGGAYAIAAIVALGYLLAALLNVYLGRLADRFGRMIPTFVGLAIGAVMLWVLPAFDLLVMLGAVAIVAQAVISALWTPTAAIVSDGAEGSPTGQAVGVAAMISAWAAGAAGGSALAGWLAGLVGFTLPFVLAGGLFAASIGVLLLSLRRRGDPSHLADSPPAFDQL